MTGSPALVALDLINEITHPDGAYPEVCLEQVVRRDVLGHAARAIGRARRAGIPVLHVVVGYSPGYPDWPARSPLFTEVPARRALVLGEWGTAVHDAVAPAPGEPVIAKRAVNPFLGTHLELLLRRAGVDSLLLCGTTTDLVVLSAAREAHDRDLPVTVLEDATATADPDLQAAAVTLLRRTAVVTDVDTALPTWDDHRPETGASPCAGWSTPCTPPWTAGSRDRTGSSTG